MTPRTAAAALGLSATLALSVTACGGSGEANTTACDDFDAAYTQLFDDVTAAGGDEGAAAEAYTQAADRLDDVAAADGIDEELSDQIEAGAEASRAEAAGENDDITEPDRTLRATVDICDELRS